MLSNMKIRLTINWFQNSYAESGNNELKQGSKVIVRESQSAVFLKGGQLADVLGPGTYSLKTENFPILTKLMAFRIFLFHRLLLICIMSTRQFIDNNWATKPNYEA